MQESVVTDRPRPVRGVRAAFVLPFAVALCVGVAYANSFHGAFLLDDTIRIGENVEVRTLRGAVTGSTRPLVGLTLHLQHITGRSLPADYHAVNLLVHLLAAMTLCGLVRHTLLALPSNAFREGAAAVPAALTAAVWALHPVQTESVTYVIQRAESLMGLCYLWTLYALARSHDAGRPRAWQTAAVVGCLLGMLSKPVMITAPLAALLYDRAFLSGGFRAALRGRRGFYIALAATWLVPAVLLSLPHESSLSAGPGAGLISPAGYLATQAGVVFHYLRLVFWPRGLCLDYAWPPAVDPAAVVAPGLVVALLLGAAIVLSWRRRPAGFGLLFFFLVLAPTSSVIPIADYAVEHRLYVPLAGIVAVAVPAMWAGLRRVLPGEPRLRRAAATTAVGVVAAVLGLMTAGRNATYASVERMARDIVRQRPENFRARTMLINALMGGGEFGEAEREARELLRRNEAAMAAPAPVHRTFAARPGHYHPVALNALGRALMCRGRMEEAREALQRAAARYPGYPVGRVNLAVALFLSGRRQDALGHALAAVRAAPDYAAGHATAAFLLARGGRYAEAREGYARTLALAPDRPAVRLELAWLLAAAPVDGVRDGKRALALAESVVAATGGRGAAALDAAGAANAECGDFEEAARHARRALRYCRSAAQPAPEREIGLELVSSSREEIEARLAGYLEKRPFRLRAN